MNPTSTGRRRAGRRTVALLVVAVAGIMVALLARDGTGAGGAGKICAQWTMTPCEGSIEVPLDRDDPTRGTIGIHFAWLPRADLSRPAEGTIVGAIGGPGAPNGLEIWTEALEPLLDRWNLLAMDYRGTGRSGALGCDELTGTVVAEGRAAVREAVQACTVRLGDDAALYTTAAAADDLAELLDGLSVDQVDLYGNSWGTFFSQTFALRHPERLRTLSLDSSMRLDADPFRRSEIAWPLQALRNVCAGSAHCPGGGDPAAQWSAVIERVRAERPSGISVEDLAGLHVGFPDRSSGRELIAATRAFLADDQAPLRRLVAAQERFAAASLEVFASHPGPIDPTQGSELMGLAVDCNDLPLPFDRTADPATRRAQFADALAALPPDAFAPFTLDEVDQPRQTGRACLDWPVRAPTEPVLPPGAAYPDVPTLVLNGDVDRVTPPSDGAVVATRFPDARHLSVPFGHHSITLDQRCAADLLVTFIRTADPGTGDAEGCTDTGFRALGGFPRTLGEVEPAHPGSGTPAREDDLRLAAAVVATVADAAARRSPGVSQSAPGTGEPGLRGGDLTFSGAAPSPLVTLDDVRFVEDVAVTGEVRWDHEALSVSGQVRLAGPEGAVGDLRITWDASQPDPTATARGRIGGRPVDARAPAT